MASAARLVPLLLVCVPVVAAAGEADVPDKPHVPDATELERKLQNPITDLMIYQIFSTVDSGVGEAKENRTIVNAQALLPLRVSE